MAPRIASQRLMFRLVIVPLILASGVSILAQRPPVNDDLLESGRAAKLVSSPELPTELTFITYNIRWRTGTELRQIADWIKTRDRFAIIALQEVDRAKQRTNKTNNARELAESLGMYYAWAAPPLPKNSKEAEEETGVELLSVYPLTEITRIVLPHEGPGGRWRVALGATIRVGKLSVRVYSVHSETRIPIDEKIDQYHAVLKDLAHYPTSTPAVVMGDFNSWEPATVEEIRALFTKEKFSTPFADSESTFRRNAIIFDIDLKLDWIWLRGLGAKQAGIDRQLTVSDHFPLWTTVRLTVPAILPK